MALQGGLFLSGDCDTRDNFFHDQQVSATLRVASGFFEEDPVCALVSNNHRRLAEEYVQARSGEVEIS
jgi:hypothetical protein